MLKRIAIGAIKLILYGILLAGGIVYWFAPIGTAFLIMLATMFFVGIVCWIFPPFLEDFERRFSNKATASDPGQDEFMAAFPPHKNVNKKVE